MNRTRLVRAAALAAAALTTLAGCSGGGGSGDSGQATTVNWWTWSPDQAIAYEQCIPAFEKANPTIKVKITNYNVSDYFTKLTSGFVSGDAPDAFMNSVTYLQSYAGQGQLLPLDDYISKDKLDLGQYAIGTDGWKYKDGKQYALPMDWATGALYYNKDLLAKAGYTDKDVAALNWTYDGGGSLWKMIKHLTVDSSGKRGDQPGFSANAVQTYGIGNLESTGDPFGQNAWGWLMPNDGINIPDKQNWATVFNYNDPKVVKSVQLVRALANDGFAPKLNQFTTANSQQVGSGKVAMVVGGTWEAATYAALKGAKIGVAPLPAGADGKRALMTNANGNNLWAGSKHPDQTWKWVKYQESAECQVERVDLSESTAWSGSPSTFDLSPTARQELPAVRKLLFAGQHAEAQRLAAEHLLGTRASFGTNLPLPHVRLTFADGAPATSYRRSLDLDQGLVSVAYEHAGVRFTREFLSSHPHGVIALRVAADRPGAVSFSLGVDGAVFGGHATVTGTGVAFTGRAVESLHSDGTAGTTVELQVHVETDGGATRSADDTFEVAGADAAVLIVAVGTDWACEDPVRQVEALTATAVAAGYDAIRAAHIDDHAGLMRRVSLDLDTDTEVAGLPTDRRRDRMAQGARDDGLLALYFQYGRYLTVAGSRADSPLPLALQGLWNDGLASSASWSSDFHLDVNTEQNYWAAEPTNLAECHTPLFRFLQLLAATGQTTATQMYNAPGWVAHTMTNAWGYTAPGTDLGWGLNVTGGAWLALDLWEHYEYGGDYEFLRHVAYPVLRGAAEFLLSYLTEDPATGRLVSGPSESPENWYVAPDGTRCSVAMGNTVDRVFAEAILRDCAAAAEVLDVDADLRERIAAARARLSPFRIGRYGQLQEWLHDFEEADPAHRHTSHLCALFPERQITPRTTPELARAAEVTIERRQSAPGWEQTEWVEANFALFHARLLQGDKALAHLTRLVTDASEANLMSYSVGGVAGAARNIYSFDGNAGGTAAVAEILLQSDGAELELLPALPATWINGSVRGLRARGGFTVDIAWKNGRLDHATIHPATTTTHRIRYDDQTTELTFSQYEPITLRPPRR